MITDSQFLRRADICRRYRISPTTFDRLRKSSRFPAPVYITPRIPTWQADEIDAAMRANRQPVQLPLPCIQSKGGRTRG